MIEPIIIKIYINHTKFIIQFHIKTETVTQLSG